MSVRFPKLNDNDVHIRDANNNLLYYDAVTKTESLTLWVVGVDSIKYKRSSDTTWQTPSGTIYVPKGRTIQFEAIKTPTNAPCFPNNYPTWKDSASGTSSTTSVTFNTTSTSTSDTKKVTAKCGTSEKSVNVLVFSLNSLKLIDNNRTSNSITSGSAISTLYIFQDQKSDSMSMDIILNRSPTDLKFRWKIERSGQVGSEWSLTSGEFGAGQTTVTTTWTPTTNDANREYVVTAWIDENGDSQLSTGELSYSLSVVIAYLEIVFKPCAYPSGFKSPSTQNSTACVLQLANKSAPCQIKANWLPTSIAKIYWTIDQNENGGNVSSWDVSSGNFTNQDEYKDVKWTQGTNTSPTRSFIFNTGIDQNNNSVLNDTEKSRSMNVEIVRLDKITLTEINNNGQNVRNVDSVGNPLNINKIEVYPSSNTNNTITLITDSTSKARVKLDMSWIKNSIASDTVKNNIRWKLDKSQGWSDAGGNCSNKSSVELTWTKPVTTTKPIETDFVLTVWADANNSGNDNGLWGEEKLNISVKIKEPPVVGFMGATLAIEGNVNRRIRLQAALEKESMVDKDKDIKILFNFIWAKKGSQIDNNVGITKEDFVSYGAVGNNETRIFQSRTNDIGWTGQYYTVTIPKNKTKSEPFYLSAKEQKNTSESVIEMTNVYIGSNHRNYKTKIDCTKTDDGSMIRDFMQIFIAKGVTRFGTPDNTPIAHFERCIDISDIKQKYIGDCYFLIGLIVLADKSMGKIHIVEHTSQRQVRGKVVEFGVDIYNKSGKKINYTFSTDDSTFLAKVGYMAELSRDYHYDTGDTTTSTNIHRNNNPDIDDGIEVWVQLYEHALSKIRGGWDKMSSGTIIEAWKYLTNKKVDFISAKNMTIQKKSIIILDSFNKNKSVCLTMNIPDNYTRQSGQEYLINEHPYYLKSINSNSGKPELELLNPHGPGTDCQLNFDDFKLIDEIYIFNSVP